MVNPPQRKVGVVSCSGEECIEGTISRIATRMVLEKLRPEDTVTICLPLFLAGGKEERAFAKDYPTVTIDGCSKLCAKIATEDHSGKIASSLVVSELMDDRKSSRPRSTRRLREKDLALTERVAEKITQEVDRILNLGR